jgi:hypothetical protein
VDALVRQPEEFGRVATAEPEVGQCFDRLDGLLLGSRTGALGGTAGSDDIVRDRRELGRELVADAQFGGRHVEPDCGCFADPGLGLSDAAPVGLATPESLDADVPDSAMARSAVVPRQPCGLSKSSEIIRPSAAISERLTVVDDCTPTACDDEQLISASVVASAPSRATTCTPDMGACPIREPSQATVMQYR